MMTPSSLVLGFALVSICCGGLSFISSRKHLLNTLLSLEFIMLSIFWLFVWFFSSLSYEIFLVLFLLTLIACEGALGLALLVSIVRTHGNDQFGAFNFLKC